MKREQQKKVKLICPRVKLNGRKFQFKSRLITTVGRDKGQVVTKNDWSWIKIETKTAEKQVNCSKNEKQRKEFPFPTG